MKKIKSLANKKFSKLTVIDLAFTKGNAFWNCKCECGKTTVVRGSYLTSGHTKSCGYCIARGDMIGKKYNRLKVINYVFTDKNGFAHWLCICECGKETTVSTTSLRRGNTTSCGCYAAEQRLSANRKEFGEAAFNRLLRTYKRNAKDRNFSFEIPCNDFKNLTSSNCFYCGVAPFLTGSTTNTYGFYLYNGIDRIDNSKGYTLENTVSCCKICNTAKNDLSLDDFKKWILKVSKNINESRF